MMPPRPEELEPGRQLGDSDGGCLFVGDKATLMCGCYGRSPRLIPETKMREFQPPPASIERIAGGLDGHEKDWLRACKGGPPASSSFDYSGPLSEMVLMGNLAVRFPDRQLLWDGEKMAVTNAPTPTPTCGGSIGQGGHCNSCGDGYPRLEPDQGQTMNNMTRLTLLTLAAFVAFGADATAAPRSPAQPNVIIFLVDDMGVMDTSVPFLTDEAGQPKRYPLNDYYRTPNMERLAARGIRFNNFCAMSVCSPTRISIMTGQNAARHHTTNWINPDKDNAGPNGPPQWNWKGLKKGDVTLARPLAGERLPHHSCRQGPLRTARV